MNAFDSTLLDGKTKLHFVGIGGSGMFPLVQILHEDVYKRQVFVPYLSCRTM